MVGMSGAAGLALPLSIERVRALDLAQPDENGNYVWLFSLLGLSGAFACQLLQELHCLQR